MYHALGEIPRRKHVAHRDEGGSLIWEELVSRNGFSGCYSTLYHRHVPPKTLRISPLPQPELREWQEAPVQPHHFFSGRLELGGDLLSGRKTLLFNEDVHIALASFQPSDGSFYRNAAADEVLFVHQGSGELRSEYGSLPFGPGDYLVIPRGILWRLEQLSQPNRFLVLESQNMVEIPRRYRNEFGQLLEHAPFCERDIRRPLYRAVVEENGPARLYLKRRGRVWLYELAHQPLDVLGWDGFHYPWAFNIRDFMPLVGKIHQPPPVHQVFQSVGFVVCNFVPRLYDWHEGAIPAPYFHQNVDSDEVLYYVEGQFMSRRGIEQGSITLHPGDVPHGPQPGKIEESIGKSEIEEWAVMVDTFRPLKLAATVQGIVDPDYWSSWNG